MGSLREFAQHMDWWGLVALLISAVAALLCITLHELSHGFVAYRLGDPTAKNAGRLTLNPIKHLDLIGLLMMVVVKVGWAKPVPVDMRYFKKPKQGMALCALAGPVSNFVFAILALLPVRWMFYHAEATAVTLWIYQFLVTLVLLNLGLGLFNLIPIPPLDGSKVLFSILPDRAYLQLMRYERYGMALLLLLVFFDIGGNALSNAISAVFQVLWNLIVVR